MRRRQFLSGLGACAASSVVGGAIGRRTSPAARAATRPRDSATGIFRVSTNEPLVGLSFDDGPDPAYTPAVLETLARYDAQATFFLIGVNALAHRDLVAAHLTAGNSIANHTLDHPDLELLPPLEVAHEIDGGERAIVASGGPRPDLFRPPKGLTDEVVGVFADADRYRTVFWTACVEHFVDHAASVAEGVQALLATLAPGSIVLAHDGGHVAAPGHPVVDRGRTMEALPLLLEGLRRRGLRPVSVDDLLGRAERERRV